MSVKAWDLSLTRKELWQSGAVVLVLTSTIQSERGLENREAGTPGKAPTANKSLANDLAHGEPEGYPSRQLRLPITQE